MSASLKTLVTSSAPEPEICPYVHERFPPGRKIGSPAVGYRENKNFSPSGSAENISNMNYQRKSKLILPRLPTDTSQIYRKNKNCSFINNHKTYLKMKGYNLNDVYSLKRNRMHNGEKEDGTKNSINMNSKLSKLSKSDLDLPQLFSNELSTPRRGSTQRDSESVWRPLDSLKPSNTSLSYKNLTQPYDKGSKVPNQARLGYLTSNRLGKVMTKTHLRSLLAQGEPITAKAFYMKPADGV